MPIQYPKISRADSRLKTTVFDRLQQLYPMSVPDRVKQQIDWELKIIEEKECESGFLLAKELMNALGIAEEAICPRGTLGSSLVAYLMGVTCFDPLCNEYPALYPEFCFGAAGEYSLSFEFNTLTKMKASLLDAAKGLNGAGFVEERYDDNDKLIGINFYQGDKKEIDPSEVFHINICYAPVSETNDEFLISPEILEKCRPRNFLEYVKCFGLTHGTDVWEDNGEVLLHSEHFGVQDLIADREDVFEMLTSKGFSRGKAFEIAEWVRKGAAKRKGWKSGWKDEMIQRDVPDWWMSSCEKIGYLFPRAHAIAYLRSFLRIGKV